MVSTLKTSTLQDIRHYVLSASATSCRHGRSEQSITGEYRHDKQQSECVAWDCSGDRAMEQLPDDAVLAVLERLDDIQDVLACRRTCKRLAELCLHPDVWRRRSLNGDAIMVSRLDASPSPCRLCPVLRLAPCLYELRGRFGDLGVINLHAMATTRCAVKRLLLYVKGPGFTDAALAIRNQQALGALRHLGLFGPYLLHCKEAEDELRFKRYSLLMSAVLSATSILHDLDVSMFDYEPPRSSVCAALSPCAVPSPSLKRLKHCLSFDTLPFFQFLMTSHRLTLEVVELRTNSRHWPEDGPGALLANLPSLRVLKSPVLPGLQAGPACDSLRQLELWLTCDTPAYAAAVTDVLRHAQQLRVVALLFSVGQFKYVDVLLAALVDSPSRASVHSLTLLPDYSRSHATLQEAALARALPSLPALRFLEFSWVSAALITAITPETAPALRTLRLGKEKALLGPSCIHACVHRADFQALLSRNVSLQLQVYARVDHIYCPNSDNLCAACAQGCQLQLDYQKVLPNHKLDSLRDRHGYDFFTIPRYGQGCFCEV